MIIIKSERELRYMYDAGQVVAKAHREVAKALKPGVTTLELDRVAEESILRCQATPAFKGYRGFPASICSSINEEVVHGIPTSLRQIKSGDIISIDIGAVLNGYVGDAAVTLPVGEIEEDVQRLLDVTKEALDQGIKKAVPNNRLSDISHAIQSYVEDHGFSVVRDFVGHGIGKNMHEEPPVPNFGAPGRGPRLKEGMTLAIEPMVNMGTYEVETLEDNWTVVTMTKSPITTLINRCILLEGRIMSRNVVKSTMAATFFTNWVRTSKTFTYLSITVRFAVPTMIAIVIKKMIAVAATAAKVRKRLPARSSRAPATRLSPKGWMMAPLNR
jgi:methionyl aminopeptidase